MSHLFQLVDTTIEIANKVGAADIVSRVVDDLKDDSEQYRKMVMETIEKVMSTLGSAEIDARLEEQLIDGILYAFQEQSTEVSLFKIPMIDTIVFAFSIRSIWLMRFVISLPFVTEGVTFRCLLYTPGI